MDDRLRRAMAALKKGSDDHEAAHKKAEERRDERRRKIARNRLRQASEEQEAQEVAEAINQRVRLVNSTDVRKWFEEGVVTGLARQVRLAPWGVKEKTLAKRLLREYGVELTRQAVDYFTIGWATISENGRKFRGLPTINLLWGMRDTIFGEVQLGRLRPEPIGRDARAQTDEFKASEADENPDVGWE